MQAVITPLHSYKLMIQRIGTEYSPFLSLYTTFSISSTEIAFTTFIRIKGYDQ